MFVAVKSAFVPFTIESLPLLSKLQLIGFHKYKNRWAKRFGKKLGRLIFDFAYHRVKLSGQICVSMMVDQQKKYLRFDACKSRSNNPPQ